MIRFHQLLERENTKVIMLYRSHLWDWFLSWVALRQTGAFQQTQRDAEWNKPEIKLRNVSGDFIQRWYETARNFLNISLSYHRWAVHRADRLLQTPARTAPAAAARRRLNRLHEVLIQTNTIQQNAPWIRIFKLDPLRLAHRFVFYA